MFLSTYIILNILIMIKVRGLSVGGGLWCNSSCFLGGGLLTGIVGIGRGQRQSRRLTIAYQVQSPK